MKKLILLMFIIVTIVGCSDSDGTPTVPFFPIGPTFPVKVDIVSYALPAESKNWKYAVSDNISNAYRDNYARANYIVERLGKASGSASPNAYIRVLGSSRNDSYHFDNYVHIYIYSASKDKLLYRASLEPAKGSSPATLYNAIVDFAIDSIKYYPQDSFSGVVELPY